MNENLIIDNLKIKFNDCSMRKLSDKEEENIVNTISRFESLGNYSLVLLSEAVEIVKDENSSYLLMLNFHTTYKGVRTPQNETDISDYELIGLALLKKDYGKVLIRPETIEDKLNNLFEHIDIDFDFDKKFSKKYCVEADNEEKLRNNISKQFIETIREINGLEIEIDKNILIVRLRKQFTPENGEVITKFITAINNGRN
jgi:predicted type IV restriction endonuclease